MGWTYPNWYVGGVSQNRDWALLANVNDFLGAVRERQQVLGQTPLMALKSAGDDVQDHQWIEDLQVWIEGHLGSFVVSHDAGTKRPASYYDAAASIPTYASLAALFSAAGLTTSTWRAYTTHPDQAGADQAQKIRPGDIIGPWLFEDLQKCLQALIWTRSTNLRWNDQSAAGLGDYVVVGGHGDWDEARAAVEAAWTGEGGAFTSSPGAWTEGTDEGIREPPMHLYHAEAGRCACKAEILDVVPAFANREVRWHLQAAAPYGDEFDAHGDGVVQGWQCWLVDSPAEADTTPESSTYIGASATAFPSPWCQQPVFGQPRARGWYPPASRALVRWDVVGGLGYT